ncbi:MAG: hypothetical protein ACTTI6_10820 [Treponema sp.]|uniref:hypothetical protein n=1 Tax=Treponema sp. TaxID=166 RepID=UPI003FA23DEF
MKKTMNALICAVFMVLAGSALLVSSCTTTSGAQAAPMAPRPQVVDWQGAAYGTEIPEWARIILQGDAVDKIQKMSEFSSKYIKFASARGQDVDLLKSWAAADAADTLSRSITQNVTSELGTAIKGNKDDAATVKIAEQAIGIFSSNKISGFEKSREFWVKMQQSSGKTEFEYVVLYTIDKDNFQEQIDTALGKISAKNEQEKEALSRINELVKISALRATSVAEN